jgi:poly-gamma-glutamate capsule biosynthesis protein CapA/YwtB (metallophosphatase superfamily)
MSRNSLLYIKAVGDICPGDFSLEGFGVGSLIKKNGCDYPFKRLGDVLDGADILIANLEGVISARCRDEDLSFGGLPEMADAIVASGFDIVSIANNHAFEHGAEILKETIYYCYKAGLKICGLRSKGPYYCDPVIIEKKGVSVGILAYDWAGLWDQNEIDTYLATITDGLVNYTWERDREKDRQSRKLIEERNIYVVQDVKRLKREVDVVVLLPHWGYEWTIYPPYGVILEARAFIDAGVDLIIGSHPHLAQGIEVYKGKVIAYSLGNFLFDPQPEKSFNGMVFGCALEKDSIKKYDYFAISCDDKCQPILASVDKQKKFREIIEQSTKAIISDTAEIQLDDELIYKEFETNYHRRKVKKIKYLFFAMLNNFSIIKPVFQKIGTLLELIILRFKGRKVRW